MKKQQKSGGNRKKGRNLIKCAKYRAENRRIKNKIRKIKRHLKVHINDLQSAQYLLHIS